MNTGDPSSQLEAVFFNKSKKQEEEDAEVGVGRVDSTPSLGKPSTWGSEQQIENLYNETQSSF